jgi:hypothetical protein
MQCKHCMIDASGPDGQHMTRETFEQTVDFAIRCNSVVLLISGGEPTEHPELLTWLDEIVLPLARKNILLPTITSNGLFVGNTPLREAILARNIPIQITNDDRFYPRNLDLVEHLLKDSMLMVEKRIRVVFPCRRTREAGIAINRVSPLCFNLRSATRQLGLTTAIPYLAYQMRVCSPSVNIDGSVRAGESDTCHRIGHVTDTVDAIEIAVRTMRCQRCGLEDDLAPQYKAAIGVDQ